MKYEGGSENNSKNLLDYAEVRKRLKRVGSG
jgi:hypothetical protein